jgi:hypothetical protein
MLLLGFALAFVACGDDAAPGATRAPDAGAGGGGAGDGGAETPPGSVGHDLVYDDALGVVLLVNAGLGGPSDARMMGQPTKVWSWNGTHWSLLDSSGPPVRNLGGVAYDSRRDKLVLHGGTITADLSYGDTWEWDPSGGWRRFDGPGPGTRDHTQMAYDPERGVAVLFGGQATISSFPADTWEWDGTQWKQVATSGPAPRVHHAMSFDPIGHRVLVFGGAESGMRDLSDTWAWDGKTWTQLAGSSTLGRTHARLAPNEARSVLYLVGGSDSMGLVPDFLRWDGSKWHMAMPLMGPAPRYLAGLTYDRARQVNVLFGGGGEHDELLSDVWEFDGGAWRRAY